MRNQSHKPVEPLKIPWSVGYYRDLYWGLHMRTHSRETYKPTEKWDNVTEWGLTRLTSSLTRGRILQVATVHSINPITQVSHFPNRGAAGRDQYGLLTQII